MASATRFIFRTLADAYTFFGELMTANLLWAACSLLVVTAPPAAAGLYYVMHQITHEAPVSWRTFFEGFRLHFWLAWRWALLNVGVIGLLFVNFVFYGQFDEAWASWVQGVVLGVFLVWLSLQVFVFPLLLEQREQRLRTALRNSLVFYLRRPGFCLSVLLFCTLLIALSSFLLAPAWLVITAGALAYLGSRATDQLVKELREPAEGGGG